MINASILGGSGYTGGELARLLLLHPQVNLQQITSQQYAGKFLHTAHPNLRGLSSLKFTPRESMENCDLLFCCLPHGATAEQMPSLMQRAGKIIDLSADFRLASEEDYLEWYGKPHPTPELLGEFVYGMPELHKEQIAVSDYVSGVGCNATATNLALYPLAKDGLIKSVIVDLKVGSSERGLSHSIASHHPERSGSMRSFAPTGHRHQAEVFQELGLSDLHFSVTSTSNVRGILATSHVFLSLSLQEKDIWKLYREAYKDEPFLRIVKERTGIHRLPEPKILSGSNYCDIGFQLDQRTGRLVVISAIDNLMKGAAGTAVQCMNLMLDFAETDGLNFPGLHPIG